MAKNAVNTQNILIKSIQLTKNQQLKPSGKYAHLFLNNIIILNSNGPKFPEKNGIKTSWYMYMYIVHLHIVS